MLTEPLPAGFGAYESGEQFPWGNLKHTPAELSYAGQNGGQTEPDPDMTLALTPWFGHGYEPPWSANEPGQGYASGDNDRGFDEYGDPLDDLFTLPDLASSMGEGWNVGMTYDLNSPASVLGLATSQADWEADQQLGVPSQWWNADIVSYSGSWYGGYDPDEADAPLTNGAGLAALLTNAVHGVVGDMPSPPDSTLVDASSTTTGWTPPDPGAPPADPPPPGGAIPGPDSVAVPRNNAEAPQGEHGAAPIDEVSPDAGPLRWQGANPQYMSPASDRFLPFDPQYLGGESDTTDAGEAQIAAVVIIVVDSETGEATEEIVPVNEATERVSAEIAQHDQARKDAHQQWVERYGTEMEFLERMRELLANPNTMKTYAGDDLIFDYIEHRNAAEELRMQLAGLTGGSYDSDWLNKASAALAEGPVSDVVALLTVARSRYPQIDQLLSFARNYGYKVDIKAGSQLAWVDKANRTIWVSPTVQLQRGGSAEMRMLPAAPIPVSNSSAAGALVGALEQLRYNLKGEEYDRYVQLMGGEDKTEFSRYDIFTAGAIHSGVATAYVLIAEALVGGTVDGVNLTAGESVLRGAAGFGLAFLEVAPGVSGAKNVWKGLKGAPRGLADDVLREVDSVVLERLRLGAEIEIPAGTQGIRKMMSDLSVVSGNEVALLRMADGRRLLVMGGPSAVRLPRQTARIIAHTHPRGTLRFSAADVRALNARGQRMSVIISPWDDIAVILRVVGN